MTVDAAIFTMSLGFSEPDPFARFVPGFYQAIAEMDPLPAKVCIALPHGDASGVDRVPVGFPVRVDLVRVESRNPTDFLKAAVENARTKWLVWCGIDDRMTPRALKDIAAGDAADVDIIAQKSKLSSGAVIGEWNVSALRRGMNFMAPNSPFTIDAYRRAGGWPDIHFHDWGLWLRMAAAGVRVLATNTVGMHYDLGSEHVTRSGLNMPDELRKKAMEEVDQIRGMLWPH